MPLVVVNEQEKNNAGKWDGECGDMDSEVPQIHPLLDTERGKAGPCRDFYVKKFLGTTTSAAPKIGLYHQEQTI